jgi:hypothetical protein
MTTERFKFILRLPLQNPDENKSGHEYAKEHGVTDKELEEYQIIQRKAIGEYKKRKGK